MSKRKQWTKKEDKKLKNLIISENRKIIWEVISHKLKKEGIEKSSKQCRERWINNLSPSVKKKKWSKFENQKLFYLFKKKGNKWKSIANEFKGRTDNSVKNNFFSLIRKNLRLICKILGKKKNTERINKFKGSVLTFFMKSTVFVDFGGFENLRDFEGFFFEKFFFLEKFEFEGFGNFKGFFEEKQNRDFGFCKNEFEDIGGNKEINFGEKNDFKNENGKFYLKNIFEKKIPMKDDLEKKSFGENFSSGKIISDNSDKKEKNIYLKKFSDEKIVDFKNDSGNLNLKLKKNPEEKIEFNFFNLNFEDKLEEKKETDLLKKKEDTFEIEIHDFITKLAFSNFVEIYGKLNNKDFYILEKIIENLFQINEKKIKEKKKKIENSLKLSKTSRTKTYFFEDSYLRKVGKISDNLNFSILRKSKRKKISKFKSLKNLNFYSKKIYKCVKKEKKIVNKYGNTVLNLKKKLISNFQKIKNCSDIILEKIQKSSEREIYEYSEQSKIDLKFFYKDIDF